MRTYILILAILSVGWLISETLETGLYNIASAIELHSELYMEWAEPEELLAPENEF